VFRVVPRNGSERIYWLADLLTDARGPTSVGLRYVPDEDVRTDVNHSLRTEVYGLRPEVEIGCQILSMTDQQSLAEIESALMTPRACDVFFSLDGGVTFRQVVKSGGGDPVPLAGKTFIGASFRLGLRCKHLIDRLPKMAVDPGFGAELLQDGGVEGWSAGQPVNWTNTVAATAVVSQETSILRGAGSVSAARVTRTAAGTPPDGTSFFAFAPLLVGMSRLKRGSWYRYRGSVYGVGFTNPGMRVQIYNSTKQIGVAPDGKTWGGASQDLIPAGTILSNAWADFEGYFRMPVGAAQFVEADFVVPRMAGYFGASNAVVYDDFSVYGPVLRPGIATW
jgi:hypothetical protein